MVALDPRINPFRPELAAKYLQGKVEAARFVEGARHEVVEPIVALRRTPSHEPRLDTQALMGERVIVYETTDECWAWGQLETDGYVGWLSANALAKTGRAPTHRVSVPRALGFPGPDIKLPPAVALPMGARLAIVRQDERFAVTAHGWHLPAVHLAPIKARLPDFVAVADPQLLERLKGTPANQWFAQREQLRRDFPQGFNVWSLEVVPGKLVTFTSNPLQGEKAEGVLLFAGYSTPGAHRLLLDKQPDIWLKVGAREMRLLDAQGQ